LSPALLLQKETTAEAQKARLLNLPSGCVVFPSSLAHAKNMFKLLCIQLFCLSLLHSSLLVPLFDIQLFKPLAIAVYSHTSNIKNGENNFVAIKKRLNLLHSNFKT
jgi:hypothetical protein